MRLFITGINGFLAREICKVFLWGGYEVFGSQRLNSDRSNHLILDENIHNINDGVSVDPKIFNGIDVIIHAAHDFKRGSYYLNVNNTKKVAIAALMGGVRQQIFISSYSTGSFYNTEYSKTKMTLEVFFKSIDGVVVRPGLIIGSGGMFHKLSKMVKILPIVPLLDEGEGDLAMVSIYDLVETIKKMIVVSSSSGAYNLFDPKLISLRDLVDEIQFKKMRKKPTVSISSEKLIIILRAIEKLGIQLPITTENIKSLCDGRLNNHMSHLGNFIVGMPTTKEAIRAFS